MALRDVTRGENISPLGFVLSNGGTTFLTSAIASPASCRNISDDSFDSASTAAITDSAFSAAASAWSRSATARDSACSAFFALGQNKLILPSFFFLRLKPGTRGKLMV